ncbi:hypothetical protein FRUB_05188 [Fimbriiglobus ruber]|uniref:Uncharacterized protein n=1 Tax=Fimbriiglobus ruber TaxID=1908690 RepID=A0A225DSX2_9BACT|nr:hypothetical protein FRUB_05188 [Fimbriiglobus ruber]
MIFSQTSSGGNEQTEVSRTIIASLFEPVGVNQPAEIVRGV